jgi:hypothetical protein
MPEPRYFSIPSTVEGAEVFRKCALNCNPCVRSLSQIPEAVIHSPAEIIAACPTVVTRSRWPRAFTRSTQKPVSELWKVTRSTSPARTWRDHGRRQGDRLATVALHAGLVLQVHGDPAPRTEGAPFRSRPTHARLPVPQARTAPSPTRTEPQGTSHGGLACAPRHRYLRHRRTLRGSPCRTVVLSPISSSPACI